MPLLPTTISSPSKRSSSRATFKNSFLAHHAKLFLLAVATLSTLALFSSMYQSTTSITSIENVAVEEWTPYKKYHESEAQLPKDHHGEVKYLWISNHLQSMLYIAFDPRASLTLFAHTDAGWGNAMQELVLNAHLAYTLNRAWVYHSLYFIETTLTFFFFLVLSLITLHGIEMAMSLQIQVGNQFLTRSLSQLW